MNVRLLVHFEDGVWWAESPDVAGFAAAEDGLQALIARAKLALSDVLDERPLRFAIELVGTRPDTTNAAAPASEGMPRSATDAHVEAVAAVA